MIDSLAEKGFRICINPQQFNGKWYWVAGVYIDNMNRAVWLDDNNGLPRAAYNTHAEALEVALDYCNNYKKPKK